MKELLNWCGEHQHYNSDVTMEKALLLAEELIITP